MNDYHGSAAATKQDKAFAGITFITLLYSSDRLFLSAVYMFS
jgi:hypothetical protein